MSLKDSRAFIKFVHIYNNYNGERFRYSSLKLICSEYFALFS